MKRVALFALLVTPFAVHAQDTPDLLCRGDVPEWRLEVIGEQAQFIFPARTEMTVRAETRAERADWPRALTLIGDRDTGILIVHQRDCGTAPYEAQMLTQRGQTPILLTGCCETLE